MSLDSKFNTFSTIKFVKLGNGEVTLLISTDNGDNSKLGLMTKLRLRVPFDFDLVYTNSFSGARFDEISDEVEVSDVDIYYAKVVEPQTLVP